MAKAIVAAQRLELGNEPGGPQPGERPSKQERETGFYDILFVGLAVDGRQVRVAVRGDRDPGYGSTSKMIAECAICLERDRPGDLAGGIWTPGAAPGDRLIKRLVDNAGVRSKSKDEFRDSRSAWIVAILSSPGRQPRNSIACCIAKDR